MALCEWCGGGRLQGERKRPHAHAWGVQGWLPLGLQVAGRGGRGWDISRADNNGTTLMKWACNGGHPSVCKWLFEVGADGYISRADKFGSSTPMWAACRRGPLSVCEWLVLKGGLNDPDSAGRHITQAIVARKNCEPRPGFPDRRPDLFAWAQGVVAASDFFRNVVIMGTFSRSSPDTTAAAAPSSPLSKLSGHEGVLGLVAGFLGARRGRELRNAREFAECGACQGQGRAMMGGVAPAFTARWRPATCDLYLYP